MIRRQESINSVSSDGSPFMVIKRILEAEALKKIREDNEQQRLS